MLVSHTEEFELIAEVESGTAFLEELRKMKLLPDVALIDMNMPGMNGVELNNFLHRRYPKIKVIVISVHTQDRLITQMIEAGVAAYLARNCDKKELVTAIQTVHKSGFYMNDAVLKVLRRASEFHNMVIKNINHIPIELTERETQVLLLICKEYTNVEIAADLHLSARTVEGHRNNLILKTGCRNTAGLVLFAVKYHIFEMEF
ncbi:DNA-binding response regulator, NarL/FixJ family, contains REC and HTH domains [Chitinophaga sp. CF118]|nr:DNA-binding response regulator, NarL/FixJ family, contains REC and HTH domains [Chitinophaga sp. CF118]